MLSPQFTAISSDFKYIFSIISQDKKGKVNDLKFTLNIPKMGLGYTR